MSSLITFHTKQSLPKMISSDYIKRLSDIVKKKNFSIPEASLHCPSDSPTHELVAKMVEKKMNDQVRLIVVVGIGGSNLGTKAIYEAIIGTSDAHMDAYPKILFLDTVSANVLKDTVEIIETYAEDASQFIVNVITKSGTTTETIANFETLYAHISKRYGDISDRVVVTTNKGSKLWEQAGHMRISRLPIHPQVGGRFSVFSSVGLFPLACAGIEVYALVKGARDMLKQCTRIKNNPALQSASTIYAYHAEGIRIINSFFFNPECESLGKWYRQLVGESLGKQFDTMGNEIREGVVPITTIGSTDLHSMAQLFLGGPKNIYTNFVYAKQSPRLSVPKKLLFPKLVNNIHGKSYQQIMQAIFSGVQQAYDSHELPYSTTIIPVINEYTIGQFLQLKMCEIMILADALNIDAFNQPNVEDYKKATRKILS